MSIFRIRIPADGGRGGGVFASVPIGGIGFVGRADCDECGACGCVRFRDSANSVAVDVKTAGNVRRGYTDWIVRAAHGGLAHADCTRVWGVRWKMRGVREHGVWRICASVRSDALRDFPCIRMRPRFSGAVFG